MPRSRVIMPIMYRAIPHADASELELLSPPEVMITNSKKLLGSCALFAMIISAACSRNSGPDPANANLAPTDQYGQPQARQSPDAQQYAAAAQLAAAPEPPPALPQYTQPACPGPNYIWTPGYWDYTEAGYYWVPGAWVMAPYVDALWTPPYWAFSDGRYRFRAGYWSRHIGFYGGINYGYGYTGFGYYGGYWNNGAFMYNRAVNNVSPRIVGNVYTRSVVNYTPVNRISYNGGPGGIDRHPSTAELAVARETRVAPVAAQVAHARQAAENRGQFARENQGRPAASAIERPLATKYNAPAPAPRQWRAQAPAEAAHAGGREAPRSDEADRRIAEEPRQPTNAPRERPQQGIGQRIAQQPRSAAAPQPRAESRRNAFESGSAPTQAQVPREMHQPRVESRPNRFEPPPSQPHPPQAPQQQRPSPFSRPGVESHPAPAQPHPAVKPSEQQHSPNQPAHEDRGRGGRG